MRYADIFTDGSKKELRNLLLKMKRGLVPCSIGRRKVMVRRNNNRLSSYDHKFTGIVTSHEIQERLLFGKLKLRQI